MEISWSPPGMQESVVRYKGEERDESFRRRQRTVHSERVNSILIYNIIFNNTDGNE